MPVSDPGSIAPILYAVQRLQPTGILELGVGFGKYGVLCREVLEAVHGRCTEDSWELAIWGIEAFEKYANPCWKAYSSVAIIDFTECYKEICAWPLVMMIDSLEHVEKDLAYQILDSLVEKNRYVIVSVPMGNCPQGAVFGNEFERHRAVWNGPEDFAKYDFELLHMGVCCVILIKGNLNA